MTDILQGSFKGTAFGQGVSVTDQQRAVPSKASLLLPSPIEKATSPANSQEIGGEGKEKDQIKRKISRKRKQSTSKIQCSLKI